MPIDTPALARAFLPSPLGELELVASDAGLLVVAFRDDTPPERVRDDGLAQGSGMDRAQAVLQATRAWLEGYFAGATLAPDVPLAPQGTPFQRAVWALLAQIPHGQTRSYEDLALALGDKKKTRAVGLANGRNPIGILVPCHRVIGKDGSLTGYAGGQARKAWLLAHERRHGGGARTPLGPAGEAAREADPGTQLALEVG